MSWMHYRALMYKNWILWKRRLLGSLCEIVFPLIVFLMLSGLRAAISAEEKDEESYLDNAVYIRPDSQIPVSFPFPEGEAFTYCSDFMDEGGEWTIGLAPKVTITEYLAEKLKNFPNLEGITVTYFQDNDEVNDYVTSEDYEDVPKLCFAIVFEEFGGDSYEYHIRFNKTETIPSSNQPVGSFIDIFYLENYDATDELLSEPKPEFQDQFIETGFILIQNWVDNYILQEATGDGDAYIAAMFVPMYYDEWVDDSFLTNVKDNFNLIFIIAYLIPIVRMIGCIVQEKEYKIKEMMSMMGLSNFAYWMSWITYYIILYLILALFAAGFIGVVIFSYSSVWMIFVFFFLFGLSNMAFSLLMSVFFSKTKTALTIGLMIFIGSFFIYFAVDDPNLEMARKQVASLIPSIAFSFGLMVMIELEIGVAGITSDTFNSEVVNYKFSTALMFLFIDTVILMILAVYLENVWPTDWGVKKPWYFLFTREFWFGGGSSTEDFDKEVEWDNNVEPIDPLLEEQKRNGKCMLVRNLTKVFNEFTAVNHLNLDIFEGQITALLGHNGAGKTTTISMLTGLFPPTSGDMKVGNLLLSKDMEKIRKNLGVCPQHNVLFNELTSVEHLYLYSIFKGMTDREKIDEKINEILQEINLIPQKDRNSEYLSGGQKRKLSLAIALIGDSKIVLLDEPTSGMDLTARRLMWDMLKNNKSERIIILTTHYMQEADILADRIAILSHGKLRCCGSSLYLKKRYGVGYYLTMVKESNVDSDAHTAMVEEFVKSFIPDAILARNIHAEMNFQIPMSSASLFTPFFEALDAQKGELMIRTYGISVTTLEEVFIRVARGDDNMLEHGDTQEEIRHREEQEREDQRLIETERETTGLFGRHMLAMLYKRFWITARDYKSMIFEIVVPLLLVLVGISFMLIADRYIDSDPYELSLDQYETPQNILYPEINNDIEEIMDIIEEYEDATTDSLEINDIEQYDKEIYDLRDVDIYRMGCYYYYQVSSADNQYEPVIFHNQSAFQSLATYYQLVTNSILQTIEPKIKIKVYNYPLLTTKKVTNTENTASGVLGALIFGLGFSFIPGAIVAYIVRDREESVKHQHTISGVSLFAYWLANYIWDLVKYGPVLVISGLMIMAFEVDAFVDTDSKLKTTWLLLFLFGVSVIVFVYSLSFYFKDYSSAQVVVIIFSFLVGSLLPVVNYIMFIFDSTRPFVKGFRWLCRLFPSYCLGNGILYVGSTDVMATLDGGSDPLAPMSMESAGGDLFMLVFDFILYLIILILLEFIEVSPFMRKCLSKGTDSEEGEYKKDEDVEAEKQRAMESNPHDSQVNVQGLRQVYGGWFKQKVVAVENVSFNVPKGECFALLGVNGAGKTSTFRMLTGEYAPTAGNAHLSGFSVVDNLDKARENIGYCPQFDALSELLTCEEHIKLYCEIKGINKKLIPQLTDDLLTDLDILEYRNFPSGTLSGGNKRKLSVAIALIGNPTVVFLDEPSAGMDPETRKKLWKVLGNIKKRDSAVILTTHSMEEAEALCDRMAIMVAGRLRCIGTSTYLRDKFGQGFELEIKLELPNAEEIQASSNKLQPILGDSVEIPRETYKECLEPLGAEDLYEKISKKGSGSSIYNQLENDGMIPRDFFITWVLTEQRGKKIFEWLKDDLGEVTIAEHYFDLYRFMIAKREDKSLGYMFSFVETNKEMMKIAEYAISPTRLDQIFAAFAAEGAKIAGIS